MKEGLLYVVATPIGNLADMTYRAIEILGSVDLIAAEDTRHSGPLLRHYDIHTQVISLHEHNERERVPELIERMQDGARIALISDAGTPLLSDPGFPLVRAACQADIRVLSVPGPSALTAALSVAGIAVDHFVFEGFLPSKPGARRKRLEKLAGEDRSLVFYESSHRIQDCVKDLCEIFGPERQAAIARELTKLYESVLRGTLGELRQRIDEDANARRGEFVVLIEGHTRDEAADNEAQRIFQLLLDELPLKQAARLAAGITGKRKNDFYKSGLANRMA